MRQKLRYLVKIFCSVLCLNFEKMLKTNVFLFFNNYWLSFLNSICLYSFLVIAVYRFLYFSGILQIKKIATLQTAYSWKNSFYNTSTLAFKLCWRRRIQTTKSLTAFYWNTKTFNCFCVFIAIRRIIISKMLPRHFLKL